MANDAEDLFPDHREYGEAWRTQLFRAPVGRDYGYSLILWRPDVNPTRLAKHLNLHRWFLRLAMTLGLFLGAGLLGGSVLVASWWLTILLGISGIAVLVFFVRALYYGMYAESIETVNERWFNIMPRGSACMLGVGGPAWEIAGMLETVAGSRAAEAGVLTKARLAELHRQIWSLITKNGDLGKAKLALREIAEEVAKLDSILAIQYEERSGKSEVGTVDALTEEAVGLTEELRAFRTLISPPDDTSRDRE